MIDRMFDDLMAVADEPPAMTPNGQVDSAAVQKQRLQVDTRKWALSKLAPRKYGEKLTLAGAGDSSSPIAINLKGLTDDELQTIKQLALKSSQATE
jgi:hypothetical protein